MKTRLIDLALILGFLGIINSVGCGNSTLSQVSQITTVGQGQQIIYVSNEATFPFQPNPQTFPRQNLSDYIVDQNIQLQRDFKPYWNIDAVLVAGNQTNDPNAFHLRIIPSFETNAPQDVVDYLKIHPENLHGHGVHVRHNAYVNFSTTGPEGSTTSSCGHEVMEMIANPTGQGNEICDGVAPFAYGIGLDPLLGQNMSDFEFPSNFQPGSAGPWDYLGKIQAQGVPAPGGFKRLF